MGEDKFIQTFAHELAHVYYGDHGRSPSEIDSTYWQPISELRADLKMEEWGALRFKEDTYLYGTYWESNFEKSISKAEALFFAKIGDDTEIITQFAHKYSKKR